MVISFPFHATYNVTRNLITMQTSIDLITTDKVLPFRTHIAPLLPFRQSICRFKLSLIKRPSECIHPRPHHALFEIDNGRRRANCTNSAFAWEFGNFIFAATSTMKRTRVQAILEFIALWQGKRCRPYRGTSTTTITEEKRGTQCCRNTRLSPHN